MEEDSSKRDMLDVVKGILLIMPLTLLVAWLAIIAIDHLVLRNPDALLSHQASDPNPSEVGPPIETAPTSDSDFSARSKSKSHRDQHLRELQEAK